MGEPEAISGNDVEKKTNEKSKTVLATASGNQTKQTTREKWWRKSIQSKGKTTPTEEEE